MVLVLGAVHTAAYSTEPSTIVFFGDSLTEGYGVQPEEAYPALIQEKIAEAGLPFEVVNAGLSGETTAAGLRRVSWILKRKIDVFVLALGGNDGMRGIPIEETEANLNAMIETVKRTQPQARVILFGIEAPPNMGEAFCSSFRAIFPRVAQAHHLPFLPFYIEGVGGVAEFNQPDGIHPNVRGHEVVADYVWEFLRPLLAEEAGR
jgi:acyl-CoA thioesterase-1